VERLDNLMAKSLRITILLAVLVSGVGHIYLGVVKRGIIILVIGIVLWIALDMFVPFPLSWVIGGGYWIWQLADAYKHYKKMKSGSEGQSQITNFGR
jgi:TM2 domain-containing membrane protein YozV